MLLRELVKLPTRVELVRADSDYDDSNRVIRQRIKLRCGICHAETYVPLPIEFDELAKQILPHVHNDDWRDYVESPSGDN